MFFKKINFCGDRVEASSAAPLSRLISLTRAKGLSGLEFLAGIPGTLGGALMMNAGAWGRCVGDLVEDVKVMDHRGRIKLLDKKDIKFKYRCAGLDGFIILGAGLRLEKNDKGQIGARIKEHLLQRKRAQDLSHPSAGCVFKNPKGKPAGMLIDKCGLKGKEIGGAGISTKHANFILNLGDASARDVLALMSLARKEVYKKFKVRLKPEIKIWR
jgi:UDP-N-acetylmuramate dehydrogenase